MKVLNILLPRILLPIIISLFMFAGCSGNSSDMAIVTIDLGLYENQTEEELTFVDKIFNLLSLSAVAEAAPPTDLTSISLTVTGPGMRPIEESIPTETGKITVRVRAGNSRKFTIFAETPLSPDKIYEGETTVDLSPGGPVVIPMIIKAKYTSEGSIASPIYIPRNNFADIHIGRVGKGKSYFYTDGVGDNFFFINLDALEDDADIIDYGDDSTYTTPVQRPMYGRTMSETISKGGWSGNLYFAIDGSQTGYNTQFDGTSFTILIESNNGSLSMNVNEGTLASPKLIPPMPSGWQYFGMCGADPGGESYYQATVKAGTPYMFHNSNSGVIQQIYSDQFVTEVLSFPFTPSSNEVFIYVDGNNSMFQIRIVTNEGSATNPVYLFTEKTNFAEVGDSSSYYLFEVTAGNNYDITVSSIYQDVDLFVFNDMNFTNQVGSSENVGIGDESVASLTASSAVFGIRIDNKAAIASTFILQVTQN